MERFTDPSDGGGAERSDSNDVADRAAGVLWPGSQDFVTVDDPASFPRFIQASEGPYVWDTDGDRYVDAFLGSGTIILGHRTSSTPNGVEATPGPSVSLRHPVEVELGETLQDLIPPVDRVAYFKTGSEAVHLAIRSALRKTDRSTIVSVGYHGWLPPLDGDRIVADDLTVVEPPTDPDAVADAVAAHERDLAAVLLGPAPGLLDADFYRDLSRTVDRAGGSVIMDEVKSGFRAGFPCLTAEFGLDPDFLVLGKAVANGSPLAILCAKESVFETAEMPETFSTFASEPASLASALGTIRALEDGGYDAFESASTHVYDALRDATPHGDAAVVGSPTFFEPNADLVATEALSRSLLDRGVLFHPLGQVLVSAAHDRPDVLDPLTDAFTDALASATTPADD